MKTVPKFTPEMRIYLDSIKKEFNYSIRSITHEEMVGVDAFVEYIEKDRKQFALGIECAEDLKDKK